MARDANCVFCKIVARDIPAVVVHDDGEVLAFLDVGPLADGHLLIIPYDHYARLVDAPAELCSRIASVVPKLGQALLAVTGAEGFNLLVNNGTVAGQVVPHVHWHLIPRKTGDSLGYRWNAGKYAEGRLVELGDAYQAALRTES
ncbi:MAG: HIT family protein [Planctomycetes bacterium]|nr:HIT family protein [Planctomycetota bacterium]